MLPLHFMQAMKFFKIKLMFPQDFPINGPVVEFEKEVMHQSIFEQRLKIEWSSSITVVSIIGACKKVLYDFRNSDLGLRSQAPASNQGSGSGQKTGICSKMETGL